MNYELLSHYLVFRKQNTLGSLPYCEKGKRFNKANVAQPWLVHLKIQYPFDRQKLLCICSINGRFFSRSSTRVTPVTQDHFYSISQGNLTVVLWAICRCHSFKFEKPFSQIGNTWMVTAGHCVYNLDNEVSTFKNLNQP